MVSSGPGKISVIIPVLNEASILAELLVGLQTMRARGHEIIVVDGGSLDDTVSIARDMVDSILVSAPGRAKQMNAGAGIATGNVFWFLHADTQLPPDTDRLIGQALDGDAFWGHFDIRLSGSHWLLRLVESTMNLRSRLAGIATGDMGIFCQQQEFVRYGGYSDIPLMEDIDFSRRFRSIIRPAAIRMPLLTSSRRWEEQGILATVLKMWRLRLFYYFGADPRSLARQYGYEP
jgi:rSAM/selenodomain-associated transferase 2